MKNKLVNRLETRAWSGAYVTHAESAQESRAFPSGYHWNPDETAAKRQKAALVLIHCIILGLALSLTFHLGSCVPARMGCFGFLLLSLYAFASGLRTIGVGFITYVMFGAYWLTNGVLIMYVFVPDYSFYSNIPKTYPLTLDMGLIAKMAQIASVGVLGFVAGIQVSVLLGSERLRSGNTIHGQIRPLSVALAGSIALACVAFYAFATPRGTIFSTNSQDITEAGAALGSEVVGSGGILFVVYALLYYLVFDAMMLTRASKMVWLKKAIAISAIFIVVVVLDFAAGRRGSVGLIVALIGVYIPHKFPRGVIKGLRLKFFLFAAVSFGFGLLAFVVGEVRYDLAHRNVNSESVFGSATQFLTSGTWFGGITTNLVTMEFFENDPNTKHLFGKTYVEYIMSLPPKQLAILLGYERPLESDKSPNWWFVGYNAGGLSPTVIPFYNFGAFGVFFIMMAQAALFGFAERRVRAWDIFGLMLYGALCSVSLVWYWYGDMPFLRAIMSFGGVGLLLGMLNRNRS